MKVKSYKYEDKGQWYLIDDDETERINRGVGEPNASNRTLYPIFDSPTKDEISAGKTTTPAWLIRPYGRPAVRWYWQVREHSKKHQTCKLLGNGLCAFKMVRYYDWNDDTNEWELLPMVNHATPEQEKVLDTN